MKNYSLTHLADHVLLKTLGELAARDRAGTVELLVHIAEVEKRRLYLPLAHPSMYSYCVKELRMSEDMAFKRIRVARAARRFPRILDAIEDGRLNLSSLMPLAPHLKPRNADELLTAAEFKTREKVAVLVAVRFPRPDVPTKIAPLPVVASPVPVEMIERPAEDANPEFRQWPRGQLSHRSRPKPRTRQYHFPPTRKSRRSHLDATRGSSRWTKRRVNGSDTRRTCLATPCPPETSRR